MTNVVPDAGLRECVNKALGYDKDPKRAVSAAEVKAATKLECRDVASFEGIQYATNAQEMSFNLSNAKKVNWSALDKLSSSKLARVSFYFSVSSSAKPLAVASFPNLAKATKLQEVSVYGIDFASYANLAKIAKLTTLFIRQTNLRDVSFMAKLKALTHAYLDRNKIADIAPVLGLADLGYAGLQYNAITTLPATAKVRGGVKLEGNAIKDFRNAARWGAAVEKE